METWRQRARSGFPASPGPRRPSYEVCEKECREHAPEHAICGPYGDACAAILEAIAGLAVT